jgi:hypothetical protein
LKHLLCLNLILKLIDVLSTWFVACRLGEEVEANPLMRAVMHSLGNFAYLFGFMAFTLCMALAYKLHSTGALIASAVVMTLIVASNLIQIVWVFYV